MRSTYRRRLSLVARALLAAPCFAPAAQAASVYTTPYYFNTMAGSARSSGSANGTGAAARFNRPAALTVDAAGVVYVADSDNNTIRRITPAGVVTTIAGLAGARGTADGVGAAARFDYPTGIAVDRNGNLFVVENFNHCVRKITPDGTVTAFAGLPGARGTVNATGTAARFLFPWGIAIDAAGNLYVSENGSHLIRKITPEAVVTTFAGVAGSAGSNNGAASVARFNEPDGLAFDAAGNLYVADGSNHQIRKITPDGTVSRHAGSPTGASGSEDAPGDAAQFFFPRGLVCDPAGNLYVSDVRNNLVRRVTPAQVVSTVAGLAATAGTADGLGEAARFESPQAIGIDAAGNLHVADTLNHTIRRSVFAPTITTPPANQSVAAGGTATFTVVATSSAPVAYQWRRDGAAIAGATGATLTIPNVQAANLGSYTVVATNVAGSATSAPATLAIGDPDPGRLINLAILTSLAGAGDSFTMGYVVGPPGAIGAKPLVIRAAGPSLAQLNVAGPLADPRLELFAGTTASGSNDNWGGGAALLAAMNSVGAFPFAGPASLDAAVATSVAAGDNSVKVSPVGNISGQVIAEIYDATPEASFTATTPRLVNVSVLKNIGPSLTAGFVIRGTGSRTVLIRAVGPTLAAAPFNVPGVVADPQLVLFNSASAQIGANDNWGGTAALTAAFRATGAFDLPAASRDAALVATLAPGNYTVQVSGVGGATGTALVEVYEVP